MLFFMSFLGRLAAETLKIVIDWQVKFLKLRIPKIVNLFNENGLKKYSEF